MPNVYAIDCEMVGDIYNQPMVARVSLVDENLNVLIDEYVAPTQRIKDYRTSYSGIQPGYENRARPKVEVVRNINKYIKGNVLVGFDVQKDLDVLGINPTIVRDLATLQKFAKRSLKEIALSELQISIQNGPHDSVEDARATMRIYKKYRHCFPAVI